MGNIQSKFKLQQNNTDCNVHKLKYKIRNKILQIQERQRMLKTSTNIEKNELKLKLRRKIISIFQRRYMLFTRACKLIRQKECVVKLKPLNI